MLENLDDFVSALAASTETLYSERPDPLGCRPPPALAVIGDLFCPKCGDRRRVSVSPRHVNPAVGSYLAQLSLGGPQPNRLNNLKTALVPSLYVLTCVQCESQFTAVIHQGADGPGLVIIPSIRGGLRTPHTAEGVAYYLDQAQRSASVGANSAALSMYRAALDQLLLDHGYTARMCGEKLGQLDAAIAARTAPKWAMDLETEYLKVLKQLGDASIHPGGAISNQAAADQELLDAVTMTFSHLLFLVYEVPHESKAALSMLKTRAAILKKTT